MINSVEKQCTTCGACLNICPVEAIKMEFNEKGFYSPTVDESKCVKCGKCIKVCPAIDYKSTNMLPEVYAAAAKDEDIMQSASGGVYPILAKYVLKNNGYVCGVAWDENWNAKHIIIDKEEDLPKTKSSKYVQSDTGNCFKQIKDLLEKGKTVLFSGTPCQNAGLLKFLDKDYENLITVDLLCHGTPSPKVWQDYLEKNYKKEQIEEINFRAKHEDWNVCWEAIYNTDYGYIKENGIKKPIGIFYEAFLKVILSHDACMNCKYKYPPRPADFTIGDCWLLRNNPKYDSKKGLSIVLANNAKASNILNAIKDDFKIFEKQDIKEDWSKIEVLDRDRNSKQRDKFFQKYIQGHDLNKILNESIAKKYDIGLITMFNIMNYGSALVSYAANKIMESLGYTTLMLLQEYNCFDKEQQDNRSREFAQKHYNISRQLYADKDEDLSDINKLADTFAVCSDTMWWDSKPAKDFCYLDFATSDKRKISFCTSFGHKEPDMTQNEINRRKYLFKRFHSLSTREEQGVNILKNIFNIEEATHLYDPTLVADKAVFDELAEQSTRKDKNFLFAYILDLTPEKEKIVSFIAEKLNLKLKLVPNMRYDGNSPLIDEKNIAIEDFVYYCKNADFIVTDSFHGTCFSVIYKKKFFSLINAWRGITRYKIFEDMNLGDRLITCSDVLFKSCNDLNREVNFSAAEEIIAKEKERAKKWLQEALTKPIPQSDKNDLLFDYLISNKKDSIQTTPKIKVEVKYKHFIERIFSVKNIFDNNKKFKVITLLGCRIKYKVNGTKHD